MVAANLLVGNSVACLLSLESLAIVVVVDLPILWEFAQSMREVSSVCPL